jgi:hypothetical protein
MSYNLITRIEEITLSGEDLMKMYSCIGTESYDKRTVKFLIYNDLNRYRNIDELFENGKLVAVYILLQIQYGDNPVGHWITIIRNYEKKKIYYYDPYGLSIEKELYITQEPRYIVDLLKGLDVQVNNIKHQQFKENINTCGRHCVLRSTFHHLDNLEYNNYVIKPLTGTYNITPDQVVSFFTSFIGPSNEVLKNFFAKK